MDTLETIKNILQDKQDIDPADVNLDSTFDSLKIDSIDMIELLCEIEDQFDIDFGEPENLHTIEDLVEYLDELIG